LEHVPARSRPRHGNRVSDTVTDSFFFVYQGGTIYVDREGESPEFWRARIYDEERFIWFAMGTTVEQARKGAEKIIDQEIVRTRRRGAW
jgi:hypothetical protein